MVKRTIGIRRDWDLLEAIEKLKLLEQFEENEPARLKYFDLLEERTYFPFSFDHLVRSINPAQIEVACGIPESMLLLYPKSSFDISMRAIDAHRIPGQRETYVDRNVFPPEEGTGDSPETQTWSWRIIDGREEVQIADWDDVSKALGERVTGARQKQRTTPLSGIDHDVYLHLQMRHLKEKGRPIDRKTWTIFDADPACDASRVPGGDFFDNRVRCGARRPGEIGVRARFRFSVGGDVHSLTC